MTEKTLIAQVPDGMSMAVDRTFQESGVVTYERRDGEEFTRIWWEPSEPRPHEILPLGTDDLVGYVMDLEALVRWFALPFRYQDQEGEWVQNEPIWTVYDERGTYLPEADRLKRTWEKVMGDA